MDRVPESLLTETIRGVALAAPNTLGGQLDSVRPTLLIFLRHFGCTFCRQMVADVRAAAADAAYPPVVFVFQGEPEDGAIFFAKHYPGVRAIADEPLRLYDAFGVKQATFPQAVGPAVWGCGIRALSRGHHQTLRPRGDVWRMPGLFLLAPDGTVIWRHHFRHIGDHPDWKTIPEHAARHRGKVDASWRGRPAFTL